MSSTGEKAGLLPLHERSSLSSPTGMDVDDETTQQTQSIHESQAHRLQGESAKGDSLLRTHGTKPHGSTSESLLSGHHDALPTAEDETPRQVIAVSASKGPAAFFNLARKFLVTDEMCDLSALEGAIVSAVDAAHLLERSQLATIVRYVPLAIDRYPIRCVGRWIQVCSHGAFSSSSQSSNFLRHCGTKTKETSNPNANFSRRECATCFRRYRYY